MSATEKNIYFPSRNEELQLEVEAGNVLGSKCKNNRRGGLASNGWPLHRSCNDVIEKLQWPFRGGGVLPYERLVELCRWMGSHFHDWIDYYGVAFLIELLEWGSHIFVFGLRQFFIFTVHKRTRTFVL